MGRRPRTAVVVDLGRGMVAKVVDVGVMMNGKFCIEQATEGEELYSLYHRLSGLQRLDPD